MGQPCDELGCSGEASRRPHGFIVGIGAEGDVAAHRVVEQERLLGDEGHLPGQCGAGEVAQVGSVEGDRTDRGVPEPGQQRHQSRLPCSRGSHDGDDAAGGDRQIDVAQHELLRRVAKRHVHAVHLGSRGERPPLQVAVRHELVGVHDGSNPVPPGDGMRHVPQQEADDADRDQQQREQVGDRDNVAWRHRPGADADCTEQQHDHRHD